MLNVTNTTPSDCSFQWKNDPIYVAFDTTSTPVWEIPFPAITICNMNLVNRAKVEGVKAQLQADPEDKIASLKVEVIEDMCGQEAIDFNQGEVPEHGEVVEEEKEKVEAFVDGLGQPCHDMLKRCSLDGKERDCQDLFSSGFNDFGLCCTFNVLPEISSHGHGEEDENQDEDHSEGDEHKEEKADEELNENIEEWNPQYGYLNPPDGNDSIPFRTTGAGISHGLSLLLDFQVKLYSKNLLF